jgi:rubrerythrin
LADAQFATRHHPKEAEIMELEAERSYAKAAEQAQDVGVRKLLGDLADMEKGHESLAAKLTDAILAPTCAPKKTARASACSFCNTSSPPSPV